VEENPAGMERADCGSRRDDFSYKDVVTFPKGKVACGAEFV